MTPAMSPEEFSKQLGRLRADLVDQGRRVQAVLEAAFESIFDGDAERAAWVKAQDDVIDRADVEIEKASVRLLAASPQTDEAGMRGILTVVKVNNEFERVADLAVDAARQVSKFPDGCSGVPETFRVMTNSVLGIVRDVNRSLERMDPDLADVVLMSEDAVESFKRAVLRDAERRIADRSLEVETAFLYHEIANICERMADHCTNVAEQIIYQATGKIVRHTEGRWEDVSSLAG